MSESVKSEMNFIENTGCSVDENIWDDSLLIKAYNVSLNMAQKELAQRIAQSTNTNALHKNKQKQNTNNDEPILKDESNESDGYIFKVGDYARATYSDGVDYEAKIISIDEGEGICHLKYIGYENEQDVELCNLVPSWGKKARRMQFAKAKQEAIPDCGNTENIKKTRCPTIPSINIPFAAVPPPMPPMLVQNHFEDSEHLSAMLMSWYMSGYYTGIYQGMQMAKTKTKLKK